MWVEAGFAEPVMDMERITLSFSTPQSLLAEMRTLGRNLSIARFRGLRTPAWRAALHEALRRGLADPNDDGRLKLSFEVIYGHAFKPAPRFAAKPQTTIDLESLRRAAKGTRRDPIQ